MRVAHLLYPVHPTFTHVHYRSSCSSSICPSSFFCLHVFTCRTPARRDRTTSPCCRCAWPAPPTSIEWWRTPSGEAKTRSKYMNDVLWSFLGGRYYFSMPSPPPEVGCATAVPRAPNMCINHLTLFYLHHAGVGMIASILAHAVSLRWARHTIHKLSVESWMPLRWRTNCWKRWKTV